MNVRKYKNSKALAALAGATVAGLLPSLATAAPVVTVTNLGTPTNNSSASATGFTAFRLSITADSGDVIASGDFGGTAGDLNTGITGTSLLQRWTYNSNTGNPDNPSPYVSGQESGALFGFDSHLELPGAAAINSPGAAFAEDNNGTNPISSVVSNNATNTYGTGTFLHGIFTVSPTVASGNLAYIVLPTTGTGSTATYSFDIGEGPAAGGTATVFHLSGTIGTTVVATKVVSLTAAGNSAGGTTALSGTFNPNSPTAGVINVVGAIPAGYVKGQLNNITNGVTGQTQIKFESSTGTGTDPGTEVIALNLADSAGGNLTTDQAQLIADINDATKGIGAGTASALLPASPFYAVFNTGRVDPYDVLLTVPTSLAGAFQSGSSFLGIDLTQDSSLSHLSVVDVAAVPEPASATVVLLGAAGLLLGRRKRKIELA
jgi:hypothetical protein